MCRLLLLLLILLLLLLLLLVLLLRLLLQLLLAIAAAGGLERRGTGSGPCLALSLTHAAHNGFWLRRVLACRRMNVKH